MLHSSYARRGDPFALMRSMMRDLDRAFPSPAAQAGFPLINMWHGDEAVAITAELPGIEPSNIEITV